MNEKEFIVGEKVLLCFRFGFERERIRRIDSITPAGNYRVGTLIFKKNGIVRGDNSNVGTKCYIEKLTPEKENELVRNIKIRIIKGFNDWGRFDDRFVDVVYRKIRGY